MSSVPQARLGGGNRGKLLAAMLLAGTALLAGCAGGPSRPTTPTYSANQRPEPARPPRPGDPLPRDAVDNPFAASRNAYDPRHMPGAQTSDVKRVAVLLPFSSTDAEVRKISQGLFNSVQMAMFEIGAPQVVLMPKDSGADASTAAAAAREAVRDGAVAVIGPLFAQHIPAVTAETSGVRAPVMAFSTDVTAKGQGAYLVSLTPETEVERIVEWAVQQGVTRFAMFGPNSSYGRTVEVALRREVTERGALVIATEFYNPGDTAPQAAARRLADVVKAESNVSPGKVAVLIPERGVQLRTVASLLPYFDVNLRTVKFLGTGSWNDPDVWREPSLYGGTFPAADPNALVDFNRRYQAAFGEAPPQLASYGYDAGALAATLANADRLDAGMIEREQGWSGVNGLFRLSQDGGIERGLAIMQLDQGQAKIVAPAPVTFGPGS
jgi:hypothetical protein